MKLSVATIMDKLGLPAILPEQFAGHEDNVGENVLLPILAKLGYNPLFDVFRKPSLAHAIVGETRAPDFGIYRYQERPRPLFGMVADVKRSDATLTPNMEEKLAGYCGLAGALYGILTNGVELRVIRPKNGVVDWDYLGHVPTKDSLSESLAKKPVIYPEHHIIYAGRVTEEITEGTIETLAKRCHEIIRSRKGMAVPERLYEFSKLLIARILDERRFAEQKQASLFLTTSALDDLEARNVDLTNHINRLFDTVKNDVGIFGSHEEIDLPVDVIQAMIKYLDQFPLWSDEIDVLGQVYEKFLIKTMTGQELGQFFTPRPIVQTLVQMIDPKRGETILDPACGSGGFLINCLIHMKSKYSPRTPNEIRALAQRIRGVDIFETATKLCQINLFLHGDCHDNVARADALDADKLPEFMMNAILNPEKHGLDCVVTNPPFGAKEGTRLDAEWAESLCKHWREHGANLFECAYANERYRDLQPQSPFMELCIKLLKKPKLPGAGGRLGIVIDNGMLSNTNKEEPSVRALIRRECIIEAIVGLPKGTFKPYGSNVIPDFMILRRRHQSEVQGPIFRGEALNIGLMPGMGSYKEASDADLKDLVSKWREWRGEGVANEGAG